MSTWYVTWARGCLLDRKPFAGRGAKAKARRFFEQQRKAGKPCVTLWQGSHWVDGYNGLIAVPRPGRQAPRVQAVQGRLWEGE